jgi:hypothetical protein
MKGITQKSPKYDSFILSIFFVVDSSFPIRKKLKPHEITCDGRWLTDW